MSLEEDMKMEIRRLKNEIAVLDVQAGRMNYQILNLIALRKKKQQDIEVIKSNLGGKKEKQISLVKAII